MRPRTALALLAAGLAAATRLTVGPAVADARPGHVCSPRVQLDRFSDAPRRPPAVRCGPARRTMSAFAREDELDAADHPCDTALPWADPAYPDANYGEGKRQAEAVLVDQARVPVVLARVAHVLAAEDDRIGRFRCHVDRIRAGRPVVAHARPGRTSLALAADVAGFLASAAVSGVTGAANVASPDPVDVHDVCRAVEAVTGRTARVVEKADAAGDPDLSPFSCPPDFGMATGRAADLGHRFTPAAEWLPELARTVAERSGSPGGR